MLAGLVQQAMGGALLRARMEARKAAFAALAGLLVLSAVTMAGVAGIIVLAGRYGIIAALLASAGLLLVLAVITFLVGRRVPGAEATAQEVRVEGALENVPAPGLPDPEHASGLAALTQLHDTVRGHIDGVMPPGGQGAMTALAASQLSKRPAATLGAAVALGAAVGLVQHRRRAAEVASKTASRGTDDARVDSASVPSAPTTARSGPIAPAPAARRRPTQRPTERTTVRPEVGQVRVHDA